MKKSFLAIVVAMMVFSTGVVLAGEKEESWTPAVEVSIGIHGKYLSESSGALAYDKAMSNQSVMIGLDKNGSGFYLQAENFAPFEKEESRETDFYVGFYTETAGMKLDAGYGHYWVRETGELDYHAVYAAVDFPVIVWQIVPFVKAEYDFAKKLLEEDENGNISGTSMDGLMYYGGLKREFQFHERVSLLTEISVGGNTGIYGMPAENLAFAREKMEVSFSLTEALKLKISVLTQQNLGKSEGIAVDTNKLFASAAIVWTF